MVPDTFDLGKLFEDIVRKRIFETPKIRVNLKADKFGEGEEERHVWLHATEPAVDRIGEVVDPKGMLKRIDSFHKNPMMYRDHWYVIGRWDVEPPKITEDGIDLAGYVSQFGMGPETYGQLREKVLRTGSIAYQEFDREPLGNGKWLITDWEMLETSIVGLPMLRQATVTSVKSALAMQDAKELHLVDVWKSLRSRTDSGMTVRDAFDDLHYEMVHKQFEAQSVKVRKSAWASKEAAEKWVKDHDFNTGNLEDSEKFWIWVQADAGDFVRLRTICINPKRDTDAGSDECKVLEVGGPKNEAALRSADSLDGTASLEYARKIAASVLDAIPYEHLVGSLDPLKSRLHEMDPEGTTFGTILDEVRNRKAQGEIDQVNRDVGIVERLTETLALRLDSRIDQLLGMKGGKS